MSPTPVLDLSGDPERLAAIVAAARRAGAADAVLVSGVLPDGHRVYGWYARDVVDMAPERPRAPRPPAPSSPPPPRSQVDVIAANLARSPVRVGQPAPAARTTAPAPTGGMGAERRRELLGHTALGRAIVDEERRAELRAIARTPAPISPAVRRALETTPLGRRVLADRAARDPDGEAAARVAVGGLTPERRRELLGAFGMGRTVLADEDRARRAAGR